MRFNLTSCGRRICCSSVPVPVSFICSAVGLMFKTFPVETVTLEGPASARPDQGDRMMELNCVYDESCTSSSVEDMDPFLP